jgi:hypothetical protein
MIENPWWQRVRFMVWEFCSVRRMFSQPVELLKTAGFSFPRGTHETQNADPVVWDLRFDEKQS